MSERENIQVLNDPATPEGLMVTWDEPQLPDRPKSSHALVVHPYFDWQRNNEIARLIADALTPQNENTE